MFIIKTIIRAYKLSLNCHASDSRLEYFIIMLFQMSWYSFYFFALSGDSLSLLLTAAFLLPLVSSNLRCLNYLRRSKAIGFLWLIAPYIMLVLPFVLRKTEKIKEDLTH